MNDELLNLKTRVQLLRTTLLGNNMTITSTGFDGPESPPYPPPYNPETKGLGFFSEITSVTDANKDLLRKLLSDISAIEQAFDLGGPVADKAPL